ncbi:hypothetical protein QJS66_03265 [Kocuria rhizophila]|nr:hypothetical protein QJS66_03265 [Kocuria rhizophila]
MNEHVTRTRRVQGPRREAGGRGLTVQDHRLAEVSVDGDFFLEPDEALAEHRRRPHRSARGHDPQEMTARIEAALPRDAVLFASTPAPW